MHTYSQISRKLFSIYALFKPFALRSHRASKLDSTDFNRYTSIDIFSLFIHWQNHQIFNFDRIDFFFIPEYTPLLSYISLEYDPFQGLVRLRNAFFLPYFELCIFCACFVREALKCTASREIFARYSVQTNVNRAVNGVHANRKISQQPANGTTVTTHGMQCKCNLRL